MKAQKAKRVIVDPSMRGKFYFQDIVYRPSLWRYIDLTGDDLKRTLNWAYRPVNTQRVGG